MRERLGENNSQSVSHEQVPPLPEHREVEPEEHWLDIDDRFWGVMATQLGVDHIGGREAIKIIFASRDPSFTRTRQRLLDSGVATPKNVNRFVVGKYFTATDAIEFNLTLERIRRLGVHVEELIVHELIHLAQDYAQKYPDMASHIITGAHDKESPWEKEAYRLQTKLLPYFERFCQLDE